MPHQEMPVCCVLICYVKMFILLSLVSPAVVLRASSCSFDSSVSQHVKYNLFKYTYRIKEVCIENVNSE